MKPSFTLLELPIVAGIIAILAATAVPNYVDARLRAELTETQVDLNAVTGALYRYRVDTNSYPPITANSAESLGRLERMELLNFRPLDHFKLENNDQFRYTSYYFDYRKVNLAGRSRGITTAATVIPPPSVYYVWCVSSVGPDLVRQYGNFASDNLFPTTYDSSNGLRSPGEVLTIVQGP